MRMSRVLGDNSESRGDKAVVSIFTFSSNSRRRRRHLID